jgi:thiol-disulfide isomerase/thioredoxin
MLPAMKALHIGLITAAALVAGGFALEYSGSRKGPLAQLTAPLASAHAESRMPPLDGAVEWLNTRPLSAAELRGKVVLVNFWTYTCINWLRTASHVRAWSEKYKDHGLVVIGVHTPEFSFEKDLPKVRQMVSQLKVDHPVAVDSNYTIWRAFDNNAWPALYFIDARGNVRHSHLGEGDFERSEKVLQALLTEAGAKGFDPGLVQVDGRGLEAPADWNNLRTPETYVGYARTANFSSPGGVSRDRPRRYEAPEMLRANAWALSGDWRIGAEAASVQRENGRLLYRFHARDLHLVMGSAGGKPIAFRVRVDGQPPGPAHGTDIDAEGRGTLVEHRLYQLVRQPGEVKDRHFEIEFLKPGAEVFAFTFG